jgi:hypothetical protein
MMQTNQNDAQVAPIVLGHSTLFPILSEEQLLKTKKILFVAQLAIGDFAYLQSQFAAFKKKYPWISIDLWIDDLRRTWCFWRWNSLKKYVIYDWVENCGLFNKVYKQSYAWPLFYKSIKQAAQEEYPIVVFIGMMRPHQYVGYMRKMAPRGYLVSLVHPDKKYRAYKDLQATIPFDLNKEKQTKHITQIFADWFEQLCGLQVAPQDRQPFVNLTSSWQSYGKLKLVKWGVVRSNERVCPLVFINSFAKSSKRCWSVERVAELVKRLKSEFSEFTHAKFVINALPEEIASVEKVIKRSGLTDTIVFTAQESFFQLPAVLSLADLVISVDTSVVHLATAFKRPLIVLMRTKQLEWKPQDTERTDVIIAQDGSHVMTIKVDTVVRAAHKMMQKMMGASGD